MNLESDKLHVFVWQEADGAICEARIGGISRAVFHGPRENGTMRSVLAKATAASRVLSWRARTCTTRCSCSARRSRCSSNRRVCCVSWFSTCAWTGGTTIPHGYAAAAVSDTCRTFVGSAKKSVRPSPAPKTSPPNWRSPASAAERLPVDSGAPREQVQQRPCPHHSRMRSLFWHRRLKHFDI